MLSRASADAVKQLCKLLAQRTFSGWQVSSCGRVCNTRGRVSWGTRTNDGYNTCHIDGATHYVHKLVAQAFLGPPPSAECRVAHEDGNIGNNALSNLAYASVAEVCRGIAARRTRHGRRGRSVMARVAGSNEWLAYASVKQAAEALDVAATTVSRVCNRKLNHGRFEAKFSETPDLPAERWVPLVDAITGKIVP
eukprot:4569605-Amphidinium_carterae.1